MGVLTLELESSSSHGLIKDYITSSRVEHVLLLELYSGTTSTSSVTVTSTVR